MLAARFYAAGREEEMSQTVHTAITLALISGVVMAFIGVLFAKGALELMGTPDDVIGQSTLYMRIYFMGMPFFMLYNYGAAILRAVGDTKRPLFFLIISGCINAGLSLILDSIWMLPGLQSQRSFPSVCPVSLFCAAFAGRRAVTSFIFQSCPSMVLI